MNKQKQESKTKKQMQNKRKLPGLDIVESSFFPPPKAQSVPFTLKMNLSCHVTARLLLCAH
jgi:hypothetical protein